jgi:hypothetical protein
LTSRDRLNEVRLHAVRAVERLGTDSRAVIAIPALVAVMRSSLVIDHVRPANSSTRATDDQPWDETAVLAMALLGQLAPGTESAAEVIAALSEVVRSGHSFGPEFAAQALRDFGPAAQAAIPDLIRFARETTKRHGSAGERAATALGRITPDTPFAEEVVAVLTDTLQSASLNTRRSAIEALARFESKAASAIPQLRALLNDPNASISSAAAKALPALGANE